MSKLSEYLAANGIKQEDFAADVGVRQATVSRLAKRVAKPGLVLALRIDRITCGAVPVSSWTDDNAEGAKA